MNKPIIGAGGGKGGGNAARVPVEAKDSLRSKAFAQVLDLVSEGEIGGLVDGLKSVYIDGTPIQNADGTYNFTGVELDTRSGTQAQGYIPGFSAVESVVSVNVEATHAASVTRHITTANLNAVRVTIGLPQLTSQNTSTGDLNGTSVQIAIDVQDNGGGYSEVVNDTITGKTSSRYQRSYRVPLSGSGPWDIRLRRITADSTSVALQDKTWWDTYTEIIDAKLRYPNSAVVGLKIDSSQFQNIPTRGYDMKLLKVRVPSNYNPITRAYTGSWDGTFTVAWTDNPAWCFYDLVTNERYGLGGLVDASQVDKWALYQIGKYCDELVPNGFGSSEPRFTCNFYLQTRADAFKVLQDFASIFRGMVYWSTGAVTATQDAPADPVALFTAANVIEGRFNYVGSSLRARHTVALVTWNDPADQYRQKVEYVEDGEGIARYGVQQTQVVAVGCTSRGQANRVGRWLLYSERYETETVQFQVGLEGAVVRPGHIIKVADTSRANARTGGRVVSATTTQITLDSSPSLPSGAVFTLFCQLTDGSVVSSPVSSIAGNVVTVYPALPGTPQAQSIWVLSSSLVEAQTFRVVSISEEEGGTAYTIAALRHEPLKYDAIELGLTILPRDYTTLNDVPATPTGFTSSESLYRYQAEVRSKLNVGWSAVSGAFRYVVDYRKDLGNWVRVETQSADLEVLDTTPGTYNFKISARNPAGLVSAALEGTVNALGKTAPPADLAVFTYITDPTIGVTLRWDRVADLDVDVYEVRSGASWATGALVGQVYGTQIKIGLLPSGSTTYWIKALDTTGTYSSNAVSTVVTITAAAAPSVTASIAGDQLVLTWTAVQGMLATDAYEIRYGSSFAGGTSLGTIKGTSFSTKVMWAGARQFWVAAKDLSGNTGAAGQASATITVPTAVTITSEVVDNNVLLRWGDGTATLPVDFYELRKGSTWAGASVIGRVSARFSAIFETQAGTFTYWIAGYDVAGNEGTPSSVASAVNQPPDYALQYNANSTFGGTKTNALLDGGVLYVALNTSETWQTHFSSRGWTSPQDQISAGYPLFGMPSQTTASYEETIDYGTILAATKITATLTYTTVAGAMTITPKLSVKKNISDAWTDYAGVNTAYVTDFRYVKVRYDFASSGGDDLVAITNLNIRFDVKQKNDAGSVNAVSTDTGGTVVAFTTAFVDVQSITLSPKGTAARIAVYDFVNAPNPTSFKVLLFDTTGTRVSGEVGWSVKGV